jgi:DNA processing protein
MGISIDDATTAADSLWTWVALRIVPGVSAAVYHELLNRFGTPRAVLGATPRALEAAGVPTATARAIVSGGTRAMAEADVALARAAGTRLITCADADYPTALRHIPDPPPYLYVRGTLDREDRAGLALAIVGSRAASAYGCESASMLAGDLAAAGVTIVSGLAHGIDGAAHRGALTAGGRTIAVLGCGVDVSYPRAHASLAASIAAHGALVSEFPMGTPPLPHHFPIRNRIISGLARGVLVVEATDRSGSLITARLAAEQGRDVFAVPGHINAPRSQGVHRLIRNGAKLVTSAADVLEELGSGLLLSEHSPAGGTRPGSVPTVPLAPDAERIVETLADGVADVDVLVSRTGLTPQDVLRILLQLELAGVVRQFPSTGFGLQSPSARALSTR